MNAAIKSQVGGLPAVWQPTFFSFACWVNDEAVNPTYITELLAKRFQTLRIGIVPTH
jgi:hypothetical protein